MKNRKYIILLIVILSILSIIITLFMFGMIFGGTGFMKFGKFKGMKMGDELVFNEVYDTNFKHVEIDSAASNIYIKESVDNTSKVVIYGDKNRMSVDTSSDKLSIKLDVKKCAFFCFSTKGFKVEVYLPRDYMNTIDIDNSYGNISIGDFENSSITIDESCGDVFVNSAKVVNVVNDYGDVEIRSAEEISVKESCGDVLVGSVKDIKVKNNYGDIDIKNVSNYLDVSNDCGDIDISNVNISKNSYIKSSLGNVEVGSTNEIHIDAKASLGDVEVRDNYRSDVVLTIKTSCGDIEVN